MKKIFLFFTLVTLQQIAVFAQNVSNDSLKSQAINIKDNITYFTYSRQNKVRTASLPKGQAKFYQYKFHDDVFAYPGQVIQPNPRAQKWRLAVNASWSYRLAPTIDGLDATTENHVDKMRSGISFGFDMTHFMTNIVGIGIKYDLYKASYSTPSLGTEHASITFIGPSFVWRISNRPKNFFFLIDIACGYTGLTDKVDYMGKSITLKGATFGTALGVGFDCKIANNWAIGMQLALLGGAINKYEQTGDLGTRTIELDKEEYEGLIRMNLSAGIRCYF